MSTRPGLARPRADRPAQGTPLERGGADLTKRRAPTLLVIEHLDVIERVHLIGRTQGRALAFGVSPCAPAAFVGVTLVLLAAALVACLVPATRAASVDPMVALRQD